MQDNCFVYLTDIIEQRFILLLSVSVGLVLSKLFCTSLLTSSYVLFL